MLRAIGEARINAVVGYSQRFRHRFLTARQRIRDGQLGESYDCCRAGVHESHGADRDAPPYVGARDPDTDGRLRDALPRHQPLDTRWIGGKQPVEVYAGRTIVFLAISAHSTALAVVTMADGTLFSMSINWAQPVAWPGSVYGLQVGVVGTRGVLDIEDTHRDAILVSEMPQRAGSQPKGFDSGTPRRVDFLGSYRPGDLA